MDAVNGKYHNERRIITRDEFFEKNETDAFIRFIWSFGNKGTTYVWGKPIEGIKCTAMHAMLDETINERRLAFIHFLQMLKDTVDPTPNRLVPLERLEQLIKLEALNTPENINRLEASNIDYHDYKYQEGDVVYCDVPYEQAGAESCDDYGVNFDSKEFYSWAKAQPFQVYFSSYEISDDSFFKVKVKSIMSLLRSDANRKFVNEYLYSNKPIEKD